MISLVYVSQSLIPADDRSRVLDDILTHAADRNSKIGIDGLLIASSNHFAQLIEGHGDLVDALMIKISADPRHQGMRLIRRTKIAREARLRWRMVRFDRGNFGGAMIDPLLTAAHAGQDASAVDRLDSLIEVFLNVEPSR